MARKTSKKKGRKGRRPTVSPTAEAPPAAAAQAVPTSEAELSGGGLRPCRGEVADDPRPALAELKIAQADDAGAVSDEPYGPRRGVLVVGMGDEFRGDGGVGVHLTGWLAQLSWPASVVFCQADETVPKRAANFARVILLDAMEGPESPGTLYEADPEELLSRSVGGAGSGLGLLGMVPASVLKRTSVLAVHPATTQWGDGLSTEVIASMPMLLPYLRAYILKAVAEAQTIN